MRTLRTTAITLLSAALLFAGAEATVGATFKAGTYSGTTSQNRLIMFQVTKKRVKNISSGFTADCGLSSEISGLSGKVRKNGSFVAKDIGTVVKGTLKRKRATGTMRFKYGACDTGVLTWKAKHTR